MDCKAFRTESEELATGESLSRKAQAHLDSCAACRAFQTERLSLRQLIGSLEPVNAPPDFDFQLRARLATAKSAGNHAAHRSWFAPSPKAISGAVAFVLLVMGAIVFKNVQPTQLGSQVATGNSEPAKAVIAPQQRQADAPEQVAVAAQAQSVAAPQNKPLASRPSEVVRAKNGTERILQAKQTRSASPAPSSRTLTADLTFGSNPPVITRERPSATTSMEEKDATALLRVSSQPFKVMLHDRQGALRSVSLEPVVFGSQDFLGRATQRHQPSANGEGIW
ncbi:MAG: hypothetical protein QOF02_753 [Blastocatellia bacterium]|jgi:hypothetical protein|nr:hypothetical protein [Blastocatellia bacterium]